MPKDEKLRIEIIWLYNDVLAAEYKERWKTTELVTRNYQQLVVIKDIEKYIDRCDIYQRIENRTEILVEKLKLSEILEKL